MRGTVYIVHNGVHTTRRILTIETSDIELWKDTARGRLVTQGFIDCDFEFGPITAHWNKVS